VAVFPNASLAVNDFVAGRIDLMIGVYSTIAPQVKAGRVRLIAVCTLQPHPAFPGVPIGAYSPLVGERPFRRPANSGTNKPS